MFVIQSLPRCGTHLLRTALSSHGGIECFGEVFNPFSRRHGFSVERPTVAEVVAHCRSRPRPAGFAVHAYVGLEPDETGPGLDDEFRARPVVRAARGWWRSVPATAAVIALRRDNLLARYVSELVAARRDSWLTPVGAPLPAARRVAIDRGRMLDDFARTEALMDVARRRFPEAMTIRYEELVADRDRVFALVQTHLNVERRSLVPGTLKVGRPLSETIRNYAQVERWLAGTPFAVFLESA